MLNNLKDLSALAKSATAKKVLTVNTDEVVSKPQVRKTFKNLEGLAETLKTEGQQSPIIVDPKNDDDKYVIQKGERRWRACKLGGIPTIDIIIEDKEQTPVDRLFGQLIENLQRDDLPPMETAETLQVFVEAGEKRADIAKRLGKSLSYISTHLSLLTLPDCVKELYDEEVTQDKETLNNLRQFYDLNSEHCQAVCAMSLTEGITRKQSRDLLNGAKHPKKTNETISELQDGDENTPIGEQQGSTKSPHIADGESEDNSTEVTTADNTVNTSEEKPPKANEPNNEALTWVSVNPSSIALMVAVNENDKMLPGMLMTDRLPTDPSEIWVALDSGTEKLVKIDHVQLLSIKKS